MKVSEIDLKTLTGHCVDVLMTTYTELGQTPTEEVVMVMSQSLADDLQRRFKDFTLDDVKKAFKRGVRETDDFSLNVKTYYKWLTYWKRQVIWEAEYQHNTLNTPKYQIPYFKDTIKQINKLTIKPKNNEKS